MREHQIQTQIKNRLEAAGYFVIRLNSGVIPQTYKGKTRRIRLARRGTPDLMAFKTKSNAGVLTDDFLELVFVEVKAPGQKPTYDQMQMAQELKDHGAQVLLAHSYEEVETMLGLEHL